jgi:hypothetical protein
MKTVQFTIDMPKSVEDFREALEYEGVIVTPQKLAIYLDSIISYVAHNIDRWDFEVVLKSLYDIFPEITDVLVQDELFIKVIFSMIDDLIVELHRTSNLTFSTSVKSILGNIILLEKEM